MSNKISHKITLKDGNIIHIRTPEITDAEKMIRYFNIVGGESNNLLFGENEFSLGIEQEKRHIENMNNDRNSLILIALCDSEIVSVAQITAFKRKRISHNAETSISVKRKYWRQGIGTEMLKLIIKFAKENEQIINVCLSVNANNIPAIELYKKFGFEIAGIHKKNFRIGEEFIDAILMDLYLTD